MKDKLIIIDGNSIAYRAFFALPPLKNKAGEFTNAIFGFLNMTLKVLSQEKPTHFVVVFDYPLRQNFRTDLYADYKATRKPMPDELREQMPKLKELLITLGVPLYEKQGVEADDVIGTIAKKFNTDTIIVTGDRDALQLIDESTSVLLTKKGLSETQLLTINNFKSVWGINPLSIIDLKSIMGDASDNIPGVKGIGEKGATDLITKFGTLENVYNHLNEISPRNQKLLTEQIDIAKLSYKLATIKIDVELGDIDINDLILNLPFNNKAKRLFEQYEFNSLLKNKNFFSEGDYVDLVLSQNESILIDSIKALNILVENFKSDIFCFVNFDNIFYFCDENNTQYKVLVRENLIDDGFLIKEVIVALKPILENANIKKICFDYKAQKHFFALFDCILEGLYEDAKIGEWLVSSKIKTGDLKNLFLNFGCPIIDACGLIEICKKLKEQQNKFGIRELYENTELKLAEVLYDMEESGIKVDKKTREEIEFDLIEKTNKIQNQIFLLANKTFNIQSPKQVGEVLFLDLNLGDIKWGTGISVLNSIKDRHPIVKCLIEYRKYSKLLSTYIIPFKQLSFSEDSIVHTTFNQTGTITGRLSSQNPNMQNIPSRKADGREVRKIFISRFESGKLVSADYSQIELRLLAHYSADEKLLDVYKNGQDVHQSTASLIFSVPLNDVTKEQRNAAKAVNFGIIYGISAFGLSEQIGVSIEDAKKFIDVYFKTFASVKDYMDSVVAKAKENMGIVETLMGRKRMISELFEKNKMLQKFGERAAMNFPFQGSASDIIKVAMINVQNELLKNNMKSKLSLQIHDELVVDCVKEEVEKVKAILKDKMESVIKLRVPLLVSVDDGDSLFDI